MDQRVASEIVGAFGQNGVKASMLLGEPVDIVIRAFPEGDFLVHVASESGQSLRCGGTIGEPRIAVAHQLPPADRSPGGIILSG